MNFEWPLFLFGLFIFLVGSVAILLGYAGAAAEEAEHEHGALARLTLRICRALGITEPPSEEKGQEKGQEKESAERRRSR